MSAKKKIPAKKAAAPKAKAKSAVKVAAKPAVKKPASASKPASKKVIVTAPKKAPVKATAPAIPKRVPVKAVAVSRPKPKAGDGTALLTEFKNFTPYAIKKGEEYMNEEQGEHFRQILDAWKQELMEEVDRTVHHMQDEAANFPDPNDRATQESEFTMELRARDRERKLIKKIDEAIVKIDNNEYGYCEQCGVEIGLRRLEVRPTAALCIDCKSLDEIREKQRG